MVDPVAREMTPIEALLSRPKAWLTRLRRKLPYLVWYNDELDVTVTFREARLDQTDPLGSLQRGRVPEVARLLSEIGISFDTGVGCDGYDWEWDFSLRGPLSIRFRDRATKPERRK